MNRVYILHEVLFYCCLYLVFCLKYESSTVNVTLAFNILCNTLSWLFSLLKWWTWIQSIIIVFCKTFLFFFGLFYPYSTLQINPNSQRTEVYVLINLSGSLVSFKSLDFLKKAPDKEDQNLVNCGSHDFYSNENQFILPLHGKWNVPLWLP